MPTISVKLDEEEFKTLTNCKPEGYSWKHYLLSSAWLMGKRSDKPRKEWGENWSFKDPVPITKPCHDCGFCPFGQVVEVFPFSDDYRCKIFGHDCPAYWLAEPLKE